MTVRAVFRATTVEGVSPPYNTIHLKVFYPATLSGGEQEQSMGVVPPNLDQAPFPVVIFFNGFNCGPELYQWLAVDLAERGFVTVTFSWVTQDFPGMTSLTPGVDVTKLAPDTYGTAPTASALAALLAELNRMQTEGLLATLLDLHMIIIGGHSAGGRVALESANPDFFPNVVATFAYAAHTAALVQAGYKPGTILPLADAVPMLLMGGTRDGVIASSGDRYGVQWDQPTTPVSRTFEEAIAGGRGDSYLLLVEGANHFSMAYPPDPTTGRPFLDFEATQPDDQIRAMIAEAVGLFLDGHVRGNPEAIATLEQRFDSAHPSVAAFKRR